jgi:sugar lactone lactonase YvrE
VAIDSSGNYIVTEQSGGGELSSVTPGGTVTLITGELTGPVGVAIDSSGNYIVTEFLSGELSSVTPGGTVTLITGGLTGPAGVAVYPVIPAPVGGVTSPINKLAIIAPYLALVGLIIAVSTVYVIKKRKD